MPKSTEGSLDQLSQQTATLQLREEGSPTGILQATVLPKSGSSGELVHKTVRPVRHDASDDGMNSAGRSSSTGGSSSGELVHKTVRHDAGDDGMNSVGGSSSTGGGSFGSNDSFDYKRIRAAIGVPEEWQEELDEKTSDELKEMLVDERIARALGDLIADKSPVGVLVIDSHDSTIVMANNQSKKLFGLPHIAGINLKTVMPSALKHKHDGYVRSYINRWKDIGSRPESTVVSPFGNKPRPVVALRFREGGISSVEFPAKLVVVPFTGTIGATEDGETNSTPPRFFVGFIREEIERVLALSLSVQKMALTLIDCGMIFATTDGVILEMNRACSKMLRVNGDDIIGKNLTYFMPPEVAEKHPRYLRMFNRRISTLRGAGAEDIRRQSKILGVERDDLFAVRRTDEVGVVERFGIRMKVQYDPSSGLLMASMVEKAFAVTRKELDEAVLSRICPAPIVKRVAHVLSRTSSTRLESISQELENITVLDIDMVDSTERMRDVLTEDAHRTLQVFYRICESTVKSLSGWKSDYAGDGADYIFGLQESRGALRAVLAALELLVNILQAIQQKKLKINNVRMGIASGNVGSGFFGTAETNSLQWKVSGEVCSLAGRLQSHAESAMLQIDTATYEKLRSSSLKGCFEKITLQEVKGFGDVVTYRVKPTVLTEGISNLLASEKARVNREAIDARNTADAAKALDVSNSSADDYRELAVVARASSMRS